MGAQTTPSIIILPGLRKDDNILLNTSINCANINEQLLLPG
jgi:hypothetical protein